MLFLRGAEARAGIDEQVVETMAGAYTIIHYGTDGRQKYLQLYVHDTKPDGRCAEAWADFETWPPRGVDGHHHINPVRAIVCGYNRRGWSPRYYSAPGGRRWRVTGLGFTSACWRTRSARGCNNPLPNPSRFKTYEIR
jgi:hypothetical protein